MVAQRSNTEHWTPPGQVELGGRVLVDELPDDVDDQDVLVVGHTDHAVELTSALAAAGARVVLAAGGMDPTKLSPAGERMLRRLERERRATLLYRAIPDQVSQIDGLPMAYFADRRTPDLQFDHIVYASGRSTLSASDVGLTSAARESGRIWFLGEPDEGALTDDADLQVAPAWRIGVEVASVFPELDITPPPSPSERRRGFTGVIEELRLEQYNATITHFEPTHSDLWVLRIRPDHGDTSHLPGQYASLGLGFWEDRIDDAVDPQLDERWDKLIRRSYSISSRIFDDHGYLAEDWKSRRARVLRRPRAPDRLQCARPHPAAGLEAPRRPHIPRSQGRWALHAGARGRPERDRALPLHRYRRGAPQRDGARAAPQGPPWSGPLRGLDSEVGRSRLHRQAPGPRTALRQLSLPSDAHPRERCTQAVHPGSAGRFGDDRSVRNRSRPDQYSCVPVRQPGP